MGAVFGSIAALCIGGAELFGRRVVNASSALTAALIMQVVASFSALGAVVFVEGEFGWLDSGWGALSGIGLAAGTGFYFAGLVRSSSTVVAPTVATLSAVIPFIYTLFRGSQVSMLAVVGAAVAFGGVALIAAGNAEVERLRAGLIWGFLSGLSYGFGVSMMVETSDVGGSWPAVAQRVSAAVVLLAAAMIAKSALLPPQGERVNGVASGILAGLSSVFIFIGLRIDAPPTVVTQSMFPAVSVVAGFLYFGDPVAKRQIIGIGLVLAGIAAVVGT